MKDVEPQVFLLQEPHIHVNSMLEYLREVGGESWLMDKLDELEAGSLPGSELLIEFMGRLCYRSWKPGLNKNVAKIRRERSEYLLNILTVGHGSVIEHAYFSFVLHNVSRVFTAEMNRHRLASISEQSLRYVRLDDDIPFRLPHRVLQPSTIERGRALTEHIEKEIGWMYRNEGIDDTESFHAKKTITSAIRRWAPMGIGTEEGWTANIRTIRHVIEMRTAAGAEEEIRVVAHQLAEIMAARAPFLFGDYDQVYHINDTSLPPAWETGNRKV